MKHTKLKLRDESRKKKTKTKTKTKKKKQKKKKLKLISPQRIKYVFKIVHYTTENGPTMHRREKKTGKDKNSSSYKSTEVK
ncbi:hypothetical protein E2C01_044864 [Portunus trituberculatus]|uniref:Uncharacterized protein n=1 Tax=Portunus trituberculatus TaxID=210409 RepID=A0A5B7G0A4_PORTR|nr:hypothetical protein [Portunus trituberculatus]